VGERWPGPASATSGAPARRGAAPPALLSANELLGRRAAAYRDPPRPARRRSARGRRGQARGATACAHSWPRSSRAPVPGPAPAWPELGSSPPARARTRGSHRRRPGPASPSRSPDPLLARPEVSPPTPSNSPSSPARGGAVSPALLAVDPVDNERRGVRERPGNGRRRALRAKAYGGVSRSCRSTPGIGEENKKEIKERKR
jgi:hypothetical protein